MPALTVKVALSNALVVAATMAGRKPLQLRGHISSSATMSGPTAGIFGLDPGLLIAYEAAQAATEIAAGYAAEDARQAELQQQRDRESQSRRHGSLAARHALTEVVRGEEARFQRLASALSDMTARLGEPMKATTTLPIRTSDDLAALHAYLETVRTLADALAEQLTTLAARVPDVSAADLAAIVATAPDLAGQLAAFAAQARLTRQLPASVVAERRALIERVLARATMATLAAGSALPDELAPLTEELLATLSDERADALATELRLRVERYNETAAADAAARVLEQSLHDLGYEVEGIGETLFVEGGVAHFQKTGWNDYFVRLRVDAKRSTVNFNVVRAGQPGEDRQREDMLAEERWCAEFPRLKETLALRGIAVNVTRMLAAGEVPVQVVDAASLPDFGNEDERRTSQPRSMQR